MLHALKLRSQGRPLLIIAIVFVAHAVYLNVVAEDAFITFRFARHLAEGHGLVWNIGEPPVEGYTNFLWLLLSAAVLRLDLNMPLTMQVIGVAASLGAIVCTYLYGRRRLALSRVFACVPCAFLALSGPFAGWAGSGMETNLFAALLIAAGYWYVGYKESGTYQQLVLSCALLLLATLTRPEGILVFGMLVVLSLAYRPTSIKRAGIELGIAALVFLIPMTIYTLWRHGYFGYWLPNTFYAKTGGTYYQYVRGAKYTIRFVLFFIVPLTLPLLCLLGSASQTTPRTGRTTHIALWTCGIISLFYTLYIVYVGGDYMAMFRFFVPVLPFIYLLFGAIVYRIWQTIPPAEYRRLLLFRLSGIVAAAGTLLFSTPLESEVYRRVPRLKPTLMHGCYEGIQTERWHVVRLRLIGEFFDGYRTGPGESLAVTGIGAISYFAHMPIFSITAIVEPYIAHQTTTRSGLALGQGFPGHEKEDFEYVLSKEPTYILYLAPERNLTQKPQNLVLDGVAGKNYHSRSVWLIDTVNKEQGYLTFLELNSAHRRERQTRP